MAGKIIVAYDKKIVAYRYNEKKLEVLATFKNSRFHRCLMVDAIESPQDGHVDVVATMFSDGINVAHVLVLRYEGFESDRRPGGAGACDLACGWKPPSVLAKLDAFARTALCRSHYRN